MTVSWPAITRIALAQLCLAGLTGPVTAQQTGTLTGAVKDAQGGVLPGVNVSVTSDALIGGPRTAVTGDNGSYLFVTLPPGAYSVSYELTGFSTLKRENIVIQVARTTRLDDELGVGALQESVTVSGASPVVDVSSTVTQTNITKGLCLSRPGASPFRPWEERGAHLAIVDRDALVIPSSAW